MCNNDCLIPTPKILSTCHQQTFRNQDHFNSYDQTALGVTRMRDNPQMTRYTNTTRTESGDARTTQGWERPSTGRFQEIDTRRTDMRRWAILDSGASSHFLVMDAPLLYKRRTANPITVTVANRERVRSTHDGAPDVRVATKSKVCTCYTWHQTLTIVDCTTMQCRMRGHIRQVGTKR